MLQSPIDVSNNITDSSISRTKKCRNIHRQYSLRIIFKVESAFSSKEKYFRYHEIFH